METRRQLSARCDDCNKTWSGWYLADADETAHNKTMRRELAALAHAAHKHAWYNGHVVGLEISLSRVYVGRKR